MYTYTYTYICIWYTLGWDGRPPMFIYTHTNTDTHVHIHAHTCIHIHFRLDVFDGLGAENFNFIYIHTHTQTHTCIFQIRPVWWTGNGELPCLCTHTRTHTHRHTQTHPHRHTDTFTDLKQNLFDGLGVENFEVDKLNRNEWKHCVELGPLYFELLLWTDIYHISMCVYGVHIQCVLMVYGSLYL